MTLTLRDQHLLIAVIVAKKEGGMMKLVSLSLMLFGFCLVAFAAPAQAGDWELLGMRKVNYGTDRDVIPVTIVEGTFTKIKLAVLHNGIELLDLKVFFADGQVFDVTVRKFIKAGGETRVIDLPGKARIIKKVQFIYRTRGLKSGRGVVQLFGKHPGVTTSEAEPEKPLVGQKWELLGQRKVNFRTDRDAIHITVSEGIFTKIKLKVLKNGIEFVDLKVFYGNGDVQDIQVRKFIAAGGETRVIDLTGNKRVIKKVQFVYRSTGRHPSRATVQLFGKH